MKIFDIAQTCLRTGDALDTALHDCCLGGGCCLVPVRATRLPLEDWTDNIYELLIRSSPPCPSQPNKAVSYIGKYCGVLYPVSVKSLKLTCAWHLKGYI